MATLARPGSEAQDKLADMIFNFSTSLQEVRAEEFHEIVKEDHYPWFAECLVTNQARSDGDHDRFIKFLDMVAVDSAADLRREVLQATYKSCEELLSSSGLKIRNSREQLQLRNLGRWLAKLTVKRNKKLLLTRIRRRDILIDAYENGSMAAVIPFIADLLKPREPQGLWRSTKAVLPLLAEIYNTPDLEVHIKHDIEAIFNGLHVNMQEVEPTTLLQNRVYFKPEGDAKACLCSVCKSLDQMVLAS